MKGRADLARGWFAKGDSDLATARLVLETKGPYDTACFHAQQVAEKYLKGLLAARDQQVPRIHTLENLGALCRSIEPSLQLADAEIAGLTNYAVELRYDSDFWPPRETAAKALAAAERVRNAVLAVVPSDMRP